ncbi:MAG: hypothetical protein AAFO95_21270 [Cyanobacteria bacterium J06600_6]
MNYISDHNSLVWLVFTIYAITALLIVPLPISSKKLSKSIEEDNQQALRFASRFLTRIVLIFPLLFLLQSNI